MNEELHTQAGAPLRARRVDAARMAEHARALAARHALALDDGDERLLARLAQNADAIAAACAALTQAARAGRVPPAAERLLDAWRALGQHILRVRRDLPPAESRALPRLAAAGEAAGQPRIYALALDLVTHGDGRLDEDSLARFVEHYQHGAQLSLGELRALPAMLRLALIENLRRLAVRLEAAVGQRALAGEWTARLLETAERRPGDLLLQVADMARSVQPLSPAFVAELAQRLEGQGGVLAQVLQWVDARLADDGLAIDTLAARDREDSTLDAQSLDNSLASLDLIERIDWLAFAERAGAVEQLLRRDPAGLHARTDAATRAACRQTVEHLARESGQGETEVAAAALALAGAAASSDAGERHVGYYLLGPGLPLLRAQLTPGTGALAALRRTARARPLASYLGAVGGFTLLFTAALLVHAWQGGAGASLLVALGMLAAIGASQLASMLTRLMAARLARPRLLPRMDTGGGIPFEARTLVAVSAILDTREQVRALCAGLGQRYLSNRDPQLRFCLLSDFTDAPDETMFGDEELLEEARAGIATLNARYGAEESGPFLLLHRPRKWSTSEHAWIGCERKRGKLADLNAFLRGGARERFMVAEGRIDDLPAVRYVIMLDADTFLPQDSARRMVAAMLHPLNRPLLDAGGRRVIAGHALLQPRVTAAAPREHASRYERLLGGGPGIDPDAHTASDVYQDLFGEGSFLGKGIYEVDTYTRVLGGRLPDNAVLSHDLLEGCYLRSAVLGDTQLVEAVPARYSDDIARRHRRIRGDWQLAGWLRARVPGPGGQREANPLNPLSRWKLFDNLRRSLVAPSLTAFLVLCWSLLPGPAFWSAAALSVFFLPAFIEIVLSLADKPHDLLWRQHLPHWARGAACSLGHAVTNTAFLPHEAWFSVHAIARTGWRMLVSRRRLLQWRASSLVRSSTDVESAWRSMWFAPLFAVVVAVLLTFLHPFALFAAAPLLLLWFLSPLVAWWVSLPYERPPAGLAPEQTQFLEKLARRSWAFFEDAVTSGTHWLAPGGVQERPEAATAHTTSPTHIGLSLLANLTAWDFGFVPQSTVLTRVRAAFESMALLERHNGHFCSGYDTCTLAPLQPLRISTTDSGNLAGHLLTLAAGLEGLLDAPIAGMRALEGLRATLQVVEEHAQGAPLRVRKALEACRDALAPERCRNGDTLPGLADCLAAAVRAASMLLATLPDEADPALRDWAQRLDADCRAARDDLLALAPWIRVVQEYVLDASLTRIPTLRELAYFAMRVAGEGDAERALAQMVEEGAATARARLREIGTLAEVARAFADMDFSWLLRHETGLLAAGFDLGSGQLEEGDCTLLASNARLASFVGVAQGQLAPAHWHALSRQLCMVGSDQLLLSPHGALGDYLMPQLVMPAFRDTLLERSCRAAVRVQIDYAARRGIPWGLSDSACNRFDSALHYARRAFGVAGCAAARGMNEDLVAAPYASLLALMVAPQAACANLERIAALGAAGRYGLYEAIDYTGARLPRGQRHAVVRAWCADHQAAGLLALSALLHGRPMQARFEADPQLRAALLLLQEPVPRTGAIEAAGFEHDVQGSAPEAPLPARSVTRVGVAQPQLQLLSNGRYHVMVNSDGGGYSRLGELALTRWRFDATCDDWGLFCYLRDLDSGALWSGAWQPTLAQPEHYEAVFGEEKVLLRRRDDDIECVTEIVVASEDDAELRRMRIKNLSGRPRRIELTSYTEPVLAPPNQDDTHPAFSKLFVQSEIVADHHAILCTRRASGEGADTPVLVNALAVHGATEGTASFETSRADFIGRSRRNALPAALASGAPPLDGAAGSVLDPALVIRRVLVLGPDEEATVDLVLGVAANRDDALHLAIKYAQRGCVDHAFELAWAQGQALLQSLHVSEADAQLYARLAGAVLYPQRALRADPALIAGNARGQSGLWPYAISGELPIVLLRVRDASRLPLARQLLAAHAWCRRKGFMFDLVIWCSDSGAQPTRSLHAQLREMIQAELRDRPGGVYLQVFEQVLEEDRVLLQAVARVVLLDERGGLAEQLQRATAPAPAGMPLPACEPDTDSVSMAMPTGLLLDNGIGGFSPDGREYLIRVVPDHPTPAPWVNVLASPAFGSVVSESGQAYTWSGNAHALRLTPWDNDPVSDRGGETFYVRDEASGAFWSPTALPAPSGGAYLARHGFGYSVFEHAAYGIHTELSQFVALDAAIKYSVLRLRNDSAMPRRLSATGYVEWVLGELRAASSMHVVTERDPLSGALVARSAWNGEHSAFFHVDTPDAAFTCDRMEFIGRGGHLGQPQALQRSGLSGSSGAALDPCAALQVVFALAPGEQKELVFMLGAGGTEPIQRHQGSAQAQAVLEQVRSYWDETLGAVRIETPDPALDVMANGWLVYQTLACRMWARSAYYQSGGAYGFRDQLQDAMALVHTRPQLLREHLLLCASHQFVEGDVQHWWHPPANGGVRTRCSDDLLWLPLAACRYIRATGDSAVLGESAPYLEGRALEFGEESYFDVPHISGQRGDLYEHCVRAIRHSLRFGEHGLPLIGGGDWNDGLDRVGSKGRGESVWLGFFMIEVLSRFAELADRRADYGFATTCRAAATALGTQLDHHAWDGEWYRRAWFDDGTPLGSKDSDECRIDLVSQSWSVLSGAAGPERAASAMAAVDTHLVWPESRLVRLLDPPFEAGSLHPGSLRAYAPGLRDNGGQATHAALWCAMAFARMGNVDRAWELFDMLNPVRLAATQEDCARYRLEPYVVAGDVMAAAPHIGRGGWSWYTGSAGWMYRLVVESLLGIERIGERLVLAPQLPRGWPGFRLQYRYRATVYDIDVRVAERAALRVDGVEIGGDTLQLRDDGQAHRVELHVVRRHEPALAVREQPQSKTIT
ncbi:GH36-type glycosyl hydrolase domain-containing protein [Massilia suwonensis]|uniref:GH36-type glycosyl hydrolase domain-containing protein n=1 Tax=Massilia suwonensis TaxID=648895 RepID=A0ABW0MTE8_9BURK